MRADARAPTSRTSARSRTLLVAICALVAARAPHAAASGYGSRAERIAPKIVTGNDSGPPRLRAFTWGIGGERVGRPSNPSKLPPAMVELSVNAVAIAASGHTVLVDDAGYVYTAGRNSSAGGGGRGSPPIEDSGQIGRGGNPGAMERATENGGASSAAVRIWLDKLRATVGRPCPPTACRPRRTGRAS